MYLYIKQATVFIAHTAGDKKKLCHLTFKVTGFYWHGNDSVAEEVILVLYFFFVEKAHFCDKNFEHCWELFNVTFGQKDLVVTKQFLGRFCGRLICLFFLHV